MKYVFVGDIHGKVDVVQRALDMDGQIIFVGDFVDSFDRTRAEQRQCLELVLAAIKAGKARSVFGNHELSYLQPWHRCSGWDHTSQVMMNELKPELFRYFEPHIILDNSVLVTHAGVTKDMWIDYDMSVSTMDDDLRRWWTDKKSPVHNIGQARGGYNDYGGPFWCDFNREFRPIEHLTQVFGHTAAGSEGTVRVDKVFGNSYCIDCLDKGGELLTLEL